MPGKKSVPMKVLIVDPTEPGEYPPGAYLRFTDLRNFFEQLRQQPTTTIENAEFLCEIELILEAGLIERE